jgi:hypothetical protein
MSIALGDLNKKVYTHFEIHQSYEFWSVTFLLMKHNNLYRFIKAHYF